MENATKALLIAGSVLIVILLIAFGMRIFNSTSGTADQVEGTMQTTEMGMFNNKFLPYLGENKSKSDVLSLLNVIQAHNATNIRKITIAYGNNATGDIDNVVESTINKISKLSSLSKIEVFVQTGEGWDNGYIKEISIEVK